VKGTPRWLWGLQAAVLFVVAVLIARAVQRNWAEFRALDVNLQPQPAWLALSALAVFLSYALFIGGWRRLLAGWGHRLGIAPAARIWTLSNLGRYLPGKIWSIAGLVVLAQRAGVQGAVAAASAVAFQALVLGTGVAVVAAAMPRATSPLRLAVGLVVALASLGALAWAPASRRLSKVMNTARPLTPLPLSAVGLGGAYILAGWLAYGLSFWLFARGLVSAPELSVVTAAGIFTFSYVLGTLALFAPGGIGVREVVLISLLAPVVGSGGAIAVSVGSRILLTLTEASAALISLALVRGNASGTGASGSDAVDDATVKELA